MTGGGICQAGYAKDMDYFAGKMGFVMDIKLSK